MQTCRLGPNATEVSVVGFGGMPLSISGRPEQEVGVNVIHAALDAGMTLLDTANVYCVDDDDLGHNERLIAKAIRTWSGSRDSIVVATKGGMARPAGRWERDGRPEQLKRACDASLKALGAERIDLYQLHTPDPKVPFADSVAAIAELQSAGKVRWAGLSNVSVAQINEASSILTVEAVQNRLNPFFREALATDVVKHCEDQGIGFLAYSPVGGGRLTKKLPAHSVVTGIAQRQGVSTHSVVLAWVRAQGATVIPIPGARTVEHVRDSAASATLELTDDELAAIDIADFSTA